MGDITYGFLSGYNSVGKYTRLLVLIILALGTFASFTGATCAPSGSTTCCATGYSLLVGGTMCQGSIPATCASGCSAVSSIGCPTNEQQCVTPANAVMYPLCGVYNNVHNIIFLLAIVLVLVGGTLYAGANVMPSASKGATQGYGIGFILGGVVGVIISILAPYIIGLVSGRSESSILSVCTS